MLQSITVNKAASVVAVWDLYTLIFTLFHCRLSSRSYVAGCGILNTAFTINGIFFVFRQFRSFLFFNQVKFPDYKCVKGFMSKQGEVFNFFHLQGVCDSCGFKKKVHLFRFHVLQRKIEFGLLRDWGRTYVLFTDYPLLLLTTCGLKFVL